MRDGKKVQNVDTTGIEIQYCKIGERAEKPKNYRTKFNSKIETGKAKMRKNKK